MPAQQQQQQQQQHGLASQANTRIRTFQETERLSRNISNRNLSLTENQLPQKGLNLAVSAKNVPITEIISATESVILRGSLKHDTADELRARINACILCAYVPKSNLTKEEAYALNAQRRDNSITILQEEKSR